jgi:hypothetical protein
MTILYLNNDSSANAQPLEISQYEVVDAGSFEEALRLLATKCFDMLLIDGAGGADTVAFIVDARIVRPTSQSLWRVPGEADLDQAIRSLAAANEAAATC